ncbi:hypothetical protein HAX54_041638 [Datura stramonium]|uniref:Uncharacterized protein n=1 Tax=Datura stramonium TaxID=4076 RepID=A0ABS8W275_DATST|nr:hypothetical protein [Datura stramonium]
MKEVIDREDQCVTNEELQDNRKNSSNDTINTGGNSVKENETTVGTISINDPNECRKSCNMEMKIWTIGIPNNNRKIYETPNSTNQGNNLEKNNEGEDSDEWNDVESTEDEDNREEDSFEDGQDRIVHNEQSEEEMEYSQEEIKERLGGSLETHENNLHFK